MTSKGVIWLEQGNRKTFYINELVLLPSIIYEISYRQFWQEKQGDPMSDMPTFENYSFSVDPLPEHEGDGFAITFPDLPGCISDGDTVEQAIAPGREAFPAWMASMIEDQKNATLGQR